MWSNSQGASVEAPGDTLEAGGGLYGQLMRAVAL